MSKGEIMKGTGNSRRIPLNPPIWFILFLLKTNRTNIELEEEVYQATKEGKSDLFKRIRELETEKRYFKIYGVWNGQRNTNLFDMNIEILKRRLEESGLYSWAV